MDILTSVIAGRVYGLNLKDLPLNRLSEQKHKKRRHQVGSKNRLNEVDKTKVVPSPTVQDPKQEVASPSVTPVSPPVVTTTATKTVEQTKDEGSAPVVTEGQDKTIPGMKEASTGI